MTLVLCLNSGAFLKLRLLVTVEMPGSPCLVVIPRIERCLIVSLCLLVWSSSGRSAQRPRATDLACADLWRVFGHSAAGTLCYEQLVP